MKLHYRAECRVPQLREVLKSTSHLSLPPHSVLETSSDFQIAFNLFGAAQSQLHVSLTADARRLHIVGTKRFHDMEAAEFLWVFELPRAVSVDEIGVINGRDVHVIHIPKLKSTTQYYKQPSSQVAHHAAEESEFVAS